MTWTRPAFGAIADLVGLRTGLAFAPNRRPAVEMGIHRSMQRAGIADLEQYRRARRRGSPLRRPGRRVDHRRNLLLPRAGASRFLRRRAARRAADAAGSRYPRPRWSGMPRARRHTRWRCSWRRRG
ncbi:MAG: hypothetical protein WKF75_00315 [Singulisphaera sp.]